MNEVINEIVTDPERMGKLPRWLEAAAIMPTFPHSVDSIAPEMANFENDNALEEVTVPTFICHGDKDRGVEYSQAEQAHKRIPNAELYTVEGGWHILAMSAKYPEMFKAQVEFAKKHTTDV